MRVFNLKIGNTILQKKTILRKLLRSLNVFSVSMKFFNFSSQKVVMLDSCFSSVEKIIGIGSNFCVSVCKLAKPTTDRNGIFLEYNLRRR